MRLIPGHRDPPPPPSPPSISKLSNEQYKNALLQIKDISYNIRRSLDPKLPIIPPQNIVCYYEL
jgi:hypothetical protein